MARSLRTGPRDRDMKPDAKTRDLLKVWKGGGGGEVDYKITNRLSYGTSHKSLGHLQRPTYACIHHIVTFTDCSVQFMVCFRKLCFRFICNLHILFHAIHGVFQKTVFQIYL